MKQSVLSILTLFLLSGFTHADSCEIQLIGYFDDILTIVFSFNDRNEIEKIQFDINEDPDNTDPENTWNENYFHVNNREYIFIYENNSLVNIKKDYFESEEYLDLDKPDILIQKIAYSLGIQIDLFLFDIYYNKGTGALSLVFDLSFYSTSAYGEESGVFGGTQSYAFETLENGDLHIYDDQHDYKDMDVVIDKGLLNFVNITFVEYN